MVEISRRYEKMYPMIEPIKNANASPLILPAKVKKPMITTATATNVTILKTSRSRQA